MKILIDLIFLAILYCLGSAFFQLIRKRHSSEKVAKSLAWRSGISLALVLLLLILYKFGLVHPHGV